MVYAAPPSSDAAQGAPGTSANSTSAVSTALDEEARAAAESIAANLAGDTQAHTESSNAGTVQSHPLSLSPDELFGAKVSQGCAQHAPYIVQHFPGSGAGCR